MSEAESKSELEFESFRSEVIRGPRKGIYESILCQHLIYAVGSPPLKKTRLVCEAAMMLPEPKSVGIDIGEIGVLHKVAIAFQQTSHQSFQNAKYCFIAWPFKSTQENYTKYIKPWRQDIKLSYFPYLYVAYTSSQRERYEAKKKEVSESVSVMPKWMKFLWITRDGQLGELSFIGLINEFTTWALPKIQITYGKVAKQVNPDVYKEVLKTLGKTEEEEP